MAISVLDRNFEVDLQVFVGDTDGTPATGKTVQAAIQRKSDGQYWDWVSAWVGTIQWDNATEVGNGKYKKTYTTPDTPDQYTVYWKETTIPAYAASDFIVDDIYAYVDAIKAKTDNLPTDPADQSDVEAAITASETAVIAEIDANETKIDALQTDMDTLVDLQDYSIQMDEKIYIPNIQKTLDADVAAAATSLTLNSTDGMPTKGYLKIGTEYIYYNGLSGQTVQNLVKAKFGTSDDTHTDGDTVYLVYIHEVWVRCGGPDGKLKAPGATPSMEIQDTEGNVLVADTAMTALVTGLYYTRLFIIRTEVPRMWRVIFHLDNDAGDDSNIVKEVQVVNEPLSSVTYSGYVTGGLLYFDEYGYVQSDGNKVLWTDTMAGPIVDEFGSPLGNVIVRANLVVNGEALVDDRRPPYDNSGMLGTNAQGRYWGYANAGTYQFNFIKEGQSFVSVMRTITDSS